jgi:cytochrome P450
MTTLPTIDMTQESYFKNPHLALRQARNISPVVRMEPMGVLGVLSAEECNRLLRDARLGAAGTSTLEMAGITNGPIWDWWKLILFQTNPPVHTRLRALVNRAFTPRRAETMRGRVRIIAEELVGEAADGVLDVEGHFAHQIPVRIISEMIGAPSNDHDQLGTWSNDLGLAFAYLIPPDRVEKIEAALVGLYGYVSGLIEDRRRKPRDDLISVLIEAEEDGQTLDEEELKAMVVNLIFAGHDTTKGLISIALNLLAQNPEAMERLSGDLSLVEAAVEEVLRFEPVVPAVPRSALEPLDICGVPVERGDFVSLNIMSANRDPEAYERPDEFDISRGTRDHLTFGRGLHFCLGASLARVEAQEALRAIAQRARRLEIVGETPRFVPFAAIRRFESLRVRLVD